MKKKNTGLLTTKVLAHYSDIPFDFGEIRRLFFKESILYDFIRKNGIGEERIIDVGCSTGANGIFIKGMFPHADYLGIDNNENALDEARKNGINVLPGDNQELPLGNGIAGLTISEGVIHHTPMPFKSFSELVRITASGGRIILYVYSRRSAYYYLYSFFFPLRLFYGSGGTPRIIIKKLFYDTAPLLIPLYKAMFIRGKCIRIYKRDFLNMISDQLLTPYIFFFTGKDIEKLCLMHGLEIEMFRRTRNGQGLMYILKKH